MLHLNYIYHFVIFIPEVYQFVCFIYGLIYLNFVAFEFIKIFVASFKCKLLAWSSIISER